MRGGKFPTNFLCGLCVCVAILAAAGVRAAQDTKPQISITANHEQFIPGEAIAFDVIITLPEPVQDMQVKGFYPTPETEAVLTEVAPLTYRYEATAALPEGARKLRVTVYGRKKPNQPITPMAHEDKLVHVQAVTPDLTDNRITLTQIEDSPDPFSAVVKGENAFRGTYNLQLANAEGPRLRQLITTRNARNEIVREIETVVELQAGATMAEALSHWDGKNGTGQMLPDGVYAYQASGILYSHKVTSGNVIEQIVGVTSAQQGEIMLDNTPPTMSASQEPPPTGGWNNTDVNVTFTAQDNLSGIAEVTQPVTVSEQGKDIEVNGKAVDKAGNEATLVHKVSIDKTPPALTATQEPLPNANGWNKTDVVVTFEAQDDLSGVAEATAPVTVAEEGEDIEVPGSATDLAGNTGYAMHVVSIDKTAPQIIGLTPADGSEVTTATPEIAATLTDALSKVDPDSIEVKLDGVLVKHSYDPDTGGVSYTPAEALADGEHTVSVKCEDMADNPAEASSHFMVSTTPPPPEDTKPPVTIVTQTPEPNEAGWNNADVTLEFEAMDDLSGVAATHVLVDGEASGASAHLTEEGQHNVEYWSVDKAGNIEQHHALAVKIDKTPPVTEALVQQEAGYGGYYWDQVDVAVGASDNLSGVVEMHIQVDGEEAGSPIRLTAEGEHVITYWSLDAAGNMEQEQELRLWLLTENGDLDGDGDPNGFEREIGTQVDDAGSGLAGESAAVGLEYRCRYGFAEGLVGKFLEVFAPGGTGGFFPVHGESIELPEPFRVGPGTVPLGVEFAMPGALQGEAKGDLPGPFPGFSVSCAFGMACTLLGQTAWLSGGAQILCEVTKWDDEGNPLEWWYPYAGGGLVWMLDAQGFGLRQTINTPGLDGKRNIPLLEGMPEPAGLLDEVDAMTYDGHGVKLYLDKSKSFGALHYMPSLRPLRTDLDMSISGMDSFGKSHSQACLPYSFDPEAGTEVTVTCRLPSGPEGFQGLNADRTVHLDWPEDVFELVEAPEGGDAHTAVGKGSATFAWKLRRLDTPLPEDAKIEAWVDSIGPGHPDVAAVSIGGVSVRPAAIGDIEHSEPVPVKEANWMKNVWIGRDIAGGNESFEPISAANNTVLPGQKLVLKVMGLPEDQTRAYAWSLPMKVFKDYVANGEFGALTEVYPEDRDESKVEFYWADSDEKRKVSCLLSIGGTEHEVAASLNVRKPKCLYTEGFPRIGTPFLYHNVLMISAGPGMDYPVEFEAGVELPAGMPQGTPEGKWNWVQLWNSSAKRVSQARHSEYWGFYGLCGLDTDYPYNPPPYAPLPGSPGGYDTSARPEDRHGAVDSPHTDLPATGYDELTVDDHYEMYVMFLPPGVDSRYVPLSVVDWSWKATATKRGLPAWQLVPNSTKALMGPPIEWRYHPTWAFNAKVTEEGAWMGNEPLELALPANVYESKYGTVFYGGVLLSSPSDHDITVSLSSSDTTEAVVPSQVTIPAGRKLQPFRITVPDDADVDGTVQVRITASTAGYREAHKMLPVRDNDSPYWR